MCHPARPEIRIGDPVEVREFEHTGLFPKDVGDTGTVQEVWRPGVVCFLHHHSIVVAYDNHSYAEVANGMGHWRRANG